MRRRRFFAASGALALGTVGTIGFAFRNSNAAEDRKINDQFEALLPELMKETVVPGLAIALIRDGKLSWNRGFGVKDSGTKAPVDPDTIFEAASISKTVFAYAALKLCERGVIDLDRPLTKYVPWKFLEGDERLEKITTRHVLSHAAGFQDWRSADNPLKIHFDPGTSFAYSGEGYYYLQSVITHLTGRVDSNDCAQFESGLKVCGTDFDAFMKKNLLDPLGMKASGYMWNDGTAKQVARAHDAGGKVIEKGKPTAPAVARYGSAGGLNTTVKDYAKFLIEIVSPKKADEFRLKPETLREMARPQVKLPADQQIDGATAWALGWAVQQKPEGNWLVHSGGQSGFRSLAMASVEKKTAFIILTNGDNGAKVIYHPRTLDLLARVLQGDA
jgi:CubicO group peptidase (beta-lactamase class C family)